MKSEKSTSRQTGEERKFVRKAEEAATDLKVFELVDASAKVFLHRVLFIVHYL